MQRILITGASSGIGRQLTLDYARAGHYVIACARSADSLENLAAQCPGRIHIIQVDVSSKMDVKEKLSEVGELDKLILNAGTCEYVDIDKFDSLLFERIFQVNVLGVVYCIEMMLPSIKRGGQLVLVGSLARMLPFTRSAAYGASKAAIHYMTKSLAVDLDGKGISVHSISPGFVKTPLTDKNDFAMPFLISVEEASRHIITGLAVGRADISFPWRLAWLLKLMSFLPEVWQHKVSLRLKAKS